ncbi:MAG: DUF3971 domain-containing protein, partial [Proteobacteria bacterium]|nr:DUF3971 domain-containing protein [Pseudomonadota bacterium]
TITIDRAFVKFSTLHKIKIAIDHIDVNMDLKSEKEIILPKIEIEFSIFNLMLGRFVPSKLKIIDPFIEINIDSKEVQRISFGGLDDQSTLNWHEDLRKIWDIFLSIENGKTPIKHFEIQDAQILLKRPNDNHEIIIKHANIRTSTNDDYVNVNSNWEVNINKNELDLTVNSNCQFKHSQSLQCDVGLFNLVPKSVASLIDKSIPIANIDSRLSGNINLEINKDYKLSDLLFNLNADQGSFNYPQFFSQEMDFSNLFISGEFNNISKHLNIRKLNAEFDKTQLSMLMTIDNMMQEGQQKTSMYIKMSNLLINELEKFWPLFIKNDENIKTWVLTHLSDGLVEDAYAKIDLYQEGTKQTKLANIEAEAIFSDATLQYSPDFPSVTKADGIAYFTKNDMKVSLISGDVLDSQIQSANVTIKDFFAKTIMLNINGITIGSAADGLKHIDYQGQLAKEVDNYLNGEAHTILDIRIPIISDLKLEDVYMEVLSDIKNLNNDYLINNSAIHVKTKKDFKSNSFKTELNLNQAQINLDNLGIFKEKSVPSLIKANISFDENKQLHFKDVTWNNADGKLIGEISLAVDPLEIVNLKMANQAIGNNDFSISYNINPTDSKRNLIVSGNKIDLSHLITYKPRKPQNEQKPTAKTSRSYSYNMFNVGLGELILANGQKIKDLAVDIECSETICKNGGIQGNLGNGKNIDIIIFNKSPKNAYSSIKGKITDLSLIAKGLNISDKMISGDSKINAKFKLVKNKKVIDGSLKIDDGFSVLRNNVVEKILEDSSFEKLKEKIPQTKTDFDKLRINFKFQEDVLLIKNLIASSYFMGVTSKGEINLANNTVDLKGLIVPGYSLNRLFGIGDIPVIGKVFTPIIGEKGGGVFAVRYRYDKKSKFAEGEFKIYPASFVAPGATRNIFDLF